MKGVLAVIYLAFFTVQLSYKFYVCSSLPGYGLTSFTASRAPDKTDGPILRQHREGKLLSLDKRYFSKQLFAFLSPITGFTLTRVIHGGVWSTYTEQLFISPVLHPAQRGPPAV